MKKFPHFFSVLEQIVSEKQKKYRKNVKKYLTENLKQYAVMPGDVRTGFTQQRRKSSAGSELYQDKIDASVAVMERDEQNGMTPESVARYIRRIAQKRSVRPLYSAGLLYKFFYVLNKILPQRLVYWIVSILYIKKKK